MKSLISVTLRRAHPVPQPVGVRPEYLRYPAIYVPALRLLLQSLLRLEDYAHRYDVIYLVELYSFVLHLLPDGVYRLGARLHLIYIPILVKRSTYRRLDALYDCLIVLLADLQLVIYLCIDLWLLVLEAEILELCLDGI